MDLVVPVDLVVAGAEDTDTNMSTPLSPKLNWGLMNPILAQTLNPIIANSLLQGLPITNVKLVANTPLQINTGLNRMQTGYIITDQQNNATVWRTQPFNKSTLTLEANANCVLNLWVF